MEPQWAFALGRPGRVQPKHKLDGDTNDWISVKPQNGSSDSSLET